MNNILKDKIKDSLISVLPSTAVILILNFVLPNAQTGFNLVAFILGSVLLILGMILYSLGSEISLSPIGEIVGNRITGTKKISIILIVGFFIGFMVTIAEPDLMVLGNQLSSIKTELIVTIALGVGLFLVIALLRVFLKINLNIVLLVLYALVFIVAIFVDNKYLAMAFDSGGVTTGAITVPFIMALGIGVASTFDSKNRDENSFGVVAICSVGPIFFVILLCMIFKPEISFGANMNDFSSITDLLKGFLVTFAHCLKEVAIAILPISAFFLIGNAIFFKLPKQRITRIIVGLVYTYIGLSLFLTGVNAGFMSMGINLGQRLAALKNNWLLVPVGMVIGAFIVLAEPAVHVLCKQVEQISNGNTKGKVLLIALSVSMMISVGLAMTRILTGIPVYCILIPGYAISIVLAFVVPKTYTGIAFDSGGVASGPMATTFMLPLAIGAATVFSGPESVLTSAYGLVAFIALTPLITLQILGLVVKIKTAGKEKSTKTTIKLYDNDVIELNSER